jgi:hypothetical protein
LVGKVANRVVRDAHVEEDRVREKGGTSHATAHMLFRIGDGGCRSSPQNSMQLQGLITSTFELSDVARHLAITE